MNRFLSIAIMAALAAPSASRALEGEVTVYGTLLPFVDNARVSGATAAAPADGATQVTTGYTGIDTQHRFRLTPGTSNIGFKGGLDLKGPALQAFFQVENSVSPDANDSPNAWGSRNTALGLKGNFGRVFVGNWDTPYKYSIAVIASLRGQSPFDNAIAGNPGFGAPATTTQSGRAGAKADASFHRRQGNSIQYWTPDLHGFTGRFAVSLNEGKTTTTTTVPELSPTIYSGMLSYAKGPVNVRYAYERHQDYFGLSQMGGTNPSLTNDSSTDQGHQVAVQVSLPTNTKISAVGERLSYANSDEGAAVVDEYTRMAYFALVQQRFGDHQVWASYGQALRGSCSVTGGGDCSTKGLGASQLGLGYSYSMGKSFDLFAAYYQMVNNRSSTMGIGNAPAPATGGDIRGVGVGFLYTFAATVAAGQPKGL